jgi:iron donor protein CyaY
LTEALRHSLMPNACPICGIPHNRLIYMNETEFHRIADATIASLADGLEEADRQGSIEVEYAGGVMSVSLTDGKQLIVSKHAPSRQLWLSSPLQGGLHFDYKDGAWKLGDGRTLKSALAQDLRALAQLEVHF